ncbi:MAG: hypothetical protein LBP51_08365 [Deferribacteraceae bacterium]|jgi:hypothetical protein|nr:hypothetical protein [Deferribacteraceae bacterium]
MTFEKQLLAMFVCSVGLWFITFKNEQRYIFKRDDSPLKKSVSKEESASAFKNSAGKYKRWSVINAFFFCVYILPILAVIESKRAENAAFKEEYDRHIHKVIVYNVCTYLLAALFTIVMKTLELKGVL